MAQRSDQRTTGRVLATLGVAAALLVWLAVSSGLFGTAQADAPEQPTEPRHASLPQTEIEPDTIEPRRALPDEETRVPRPDHIATGIVLTPAGEPVAGASIIAERRAGDGYHVLDPELNRTRSVVDRTVSAADGSFILELLPGHPHRVIATASACAPASAAFVTAGAFVALTLYPGASLYGVVRSKVTGKPIAGVKLLATHRHTEFETRIRGTLFAGTTDVDGGFRFDGLAPGSIWFALQHDEYSTPRRLQLELAPGVELEHDITLLGGDDIEGTVVDQTTGRPIADAEIGEGWTFDKKVRSDAEGKFLFRAFGRAHLDLHARAAGYGEAVIRLRKTMRDALKSQPLTFALPRARTTQGRVVSDAGPIRGAYVGVFASEFHGSIQAIDRHSAITGDDGRFEFSSLRPDVHHVVMIKHDGYGTRVYDFPQDEADRPLVDLGDLRIHAGHVVLGRIVDEHGSPVADHAVTLHGNNADRASQFGYRHEGYDHLDIYVATRTARTTLSGEFTFADVAVGTYMLQTSRLGVHRRIEQPVTVDSHGAPRCEIVLAQGLVIGGRIVVPAGTTFQRIYVSVDAQEKGGSHADTQVDTDGSFAVQGLDAGRYNLRIYPYQSTDDKQKGATIAAGFRADVNAGTTDLRIDLLPVASIAGRVIDANGTGMGRVIVTASDGAGNNLYQTVTDAQGAFTLSIGAGMTVDLDARPAAKPTPGEQRNTAHRRGVAAGARDVVLTLS